MSEFSIEKISEKIHYGKTRKYFEEVLSSYHNTNYRSAVVMLWSVAVCDIIYKLQNLVDLYDDISAKKILEELTALQNKDPKSAAWEVKLIDDVHRKTNLIDNSEYENLRYLQKQRHLSAHPVLNSERELHTPNKETTRSLIRNTLENLLIKPPFYTQKILTELLEDISESAPVLNTRKKVKRYIESRYLSRTKPEVELSLFRSFWKFVFKLDNEDCEKNRAINLYTLEVLSNRNMAHISKLINGDKDYYSNIAPNGTALSFLIYYLANNPNIYELLNEDAKLKIQYCIDNDDIGKTMGWFIKDDLMQHADDVLTWIEGEEHPIFLKKQWDALFNISDSEEWQRKFCKLLTGYYCVSYNFNQADSRFQTVIAPYIHLFDKDSIISLLQKIENNDQVYGRGRAYEDHKIIKNRAIDLFGKDFEFKTYPHFEKTIENDDSCT